MASPMQLFNEWEIQLLVLLSYMLQAFLFFAGGLRRRSSNRFFRLLVWIAYLGADLVAAYALGVISRHDDYAAAGSRETHQLVLLWAPFLLIHLGGQDTITGFSLEDNNLWRRHLLNLAVQVALVLYVFWKSVGNGTNSQLLVLSILLSVTGAIKYGERTWALWSGVLKNLQYPLPRYAQKLLETTMEGPNLLGNDCVAQLLEQINRNDTSSKVGVLCVALCSIRSVLSFFWHDDSYRPLLRIWFHDQCPLLPNLLEILETELGLVYDYIYTKAVVFQTRRGIILRCISQASFLASFLLFFVSNKQRYNSIDTAVTYALFVGGFSLEVFAVFTTVRSPWTWAWLKARGCGFLASRFVRWQSKRVWWSNSMGQYSMHNYLGQYDQSSSWKQGVIRNVVDAVCGPERKFWVSKLLDIKFIEVDEKIVSCIFDKVVEYGKIANSADKEQQQSLHWPWTNLYALLQKVLPRSDGSALNWHTIAALHTYTEAQLRRYSPRPTDDDGEFTRDLVRKISHYIVYLLATQPGMLPISKDAENKDVMSETDIGNSGAVDLHLRGIKLCGITNYFAVAAAKVGKDDTLSSRATRMLENMGLPVPISCTKEDLLETKEAWIRILIYIAGRSRPELHATHLSRGGELLTFVWLFMAQRGLGDSVLQRMEVTDEILRRSSLVLFHVFPQQTDGNNSPAHGAQGSEITTV